MPSCLFLRDCNFDSFFASLNGFTIAIICDMCDYIQYVQSNVIPREFRCIYVFSEENVIRMRMRPT